MLALMMLTGMRRGEVLGLKWEDVDWENKTIRVCRNITFTTNQPTIGTTKTESGNRIVPLADSLVLLLKYKDETGYVINSDNAGNASISKMCYRRLWESIEKTIDLYNATAHIFMHTYLTLLAGIGTDVKTLQTIAGYADIKITMDRYANSQKDNIVKAGNDMDIFLQSQEKK